MNCEEVRPLLHAWHDGELDLVHTLAIEQHLEECPGCRAEQAQLQAVSALLHVRLPRETAPAALQTRVREAVAEREPHAPVFAPDSGARTPLPWLAWAAGLAAALGLGFFFGRSAQGPAASATLVTEALAAHGRAVTLGPMLSVASDDRHTVKPWLAQRLDFAPPVRDLAAAGFPLQGARLDYLRSRPVAVLIYGRRQHRLEVMVSPAAAPEPTVWTSRAGLQVGQWSHAGFRWLVLSDLTESELQEFARLLQAPESTGPASQ